METLQDPHKVPPKSSWDEVPEIVQVWAEDGVLKVRMEGVVRPRLDPNRRTYGPSTVARVDYVFDGKNWKGPMLDNPDGIWGQVLGKVKKFAVAQGFPNKEVMLKELLKEPKTLTREGYTPPNDFWGYILGL